MLKRLSTIFVPLIFAMMAFAHPLGNFSINQFSRIEPGRSQIRLVEVVDMAEIPTFQITASIDTDKDGTLSPTEIQNYAAELAPQFAANLKLSVGGEIIPVRPVSIQAVRGNGAGDLSTLKIRFEMVADYPANRQTNRVEFRNENFAGRSGWNEIVVGRVDGVNVFESDAYGSSLSEELEKYPEASLTAPLAERTANFVYSLDATPPGSRPLQNRDGKVSEPAQKDRLASLIAVPEITPLVALVGLLIAFGLGAAHALSPGHGKTIVGAYLVGSKGTPRHAIFLGLTVTVTHTLGVFALGLVTLFASAYILPERLLPFIAFLSGLLVFFIGISLLKDRLFKLLGWKQNEHQPHHPEHDHEGEHHADGVTHTHGGTTHTHAVPDAITWRSLLALGISGGLLPCPSALVLMLSAISLGRIGYGLILTVAFSFGLASTLTVIGLIFLTARSLLAKTKFAESRVLGLIPVFSALVVTIAGVVICYSALGSSL